MKYLEFMSHRYTPLLRAALPSSPSTKAGRGTSRKVSEIYPAAHNQYHSRGTTPATQTILSKIPPNNSKLTYVWEQYLFHYISDGGYIYLVMADDSAGRCVYRGYKLD